MNVVYMLRCGDGSLYTGWTNDLEKRVKNHAAGRGCKYTRSRLPVELVYTERFETEHDARSREWHIKQLTRAEKLKLLEEAADHAKNGT
ncbi:MAG: GIY-YIG nuclease family protein [Oscillospiraceae bacterium]|nr:GIY-YIG nuclease family protein [Oscillospiraceae bacterium]